MPDTVMSPSGQDGPGKKAPASNWRTTLVGVGIFCIIGAVFVGAISKEAGGMAPKVLAIAGALLLAISIAWTLISSVLSKLNRGRWKSFASGS